MTAAGEPRRYWITYLPAARAALPALLKDAAAEGIKVECADALDRIEQRLKTDPLGFGEFVGQVPSLQFLIHVGSSPPITVRFGVHKEQPSLLVYEILLRPASL